MPPLPIRNPAWGLKHSPAIPSVQTLMELLQPSTPIMQSWASERSFPAVSIENQLKENMHIWRGGERDRQTETDRQRQRQTETESDRDRERQRQRETKTERDRDRHSF